MICLSSGGIRFHGTSELYFVLYYQSNKLVVIYNSDKN